MLEIHTNLQQHIVWNQYKSVQKNQPGLVRHEGNTSTCANVAATIVPRTKCQSGVAIVPAVHGIVLDILPGHSDRFSVDKFTL